MGEKSLQGRGGMGAKVDAAISAIGGGVQAVIIAPGGERDVLDDIIAGVHLYRRLHLHLQHYLHLWMFILSGTNVYVLE